MSDPLQRPLTLPNGSILPNRIAKSAMSEALGTPDNHPTAALDALYRRWSQGGCGSKSGLVYRPWHYRVCPSTRILQAGQASAGC